MGQVQQDIGAEVIHDMLCSHLCARPSLHSNLFRNRSPEGDSVILRMAVFTLFLVLPALVAGRSIEGRWCFSLQIASNDVQPETIAKATNPRVEARYARMAAMSGRTR